LFRGGKAFRVTIELSGMTEKDVYCSERRYGSFRRAFELPGDVDASKAA
jgi:HSP20 family molecular chaperone IbpA